jgi:hypothetical protein
MRKRSRTRETRIAFVADYETYILQRAIKPDHRGILNLP